MCHVQQVVSKLGHQDRCSWNSLIRKYVKDGKARHALTLYKRILGNGASALCPHPSTYVCLLKACAILRDLDFGQRIHESISITNLFETDVYIGSSLVNMYAKCDSLAKAQEVFATLPHRSVVSWTALIAGYKEHGHGQEALECFESMQQEGISPNTYTYVSCLQACSSIRVTDKGQQMHAEIVKRGLENEDLVGNTLVDMYAKCGSLSSAQNVFNCLPSRNIVAWTALIAGYAEHGDAEEAFSCLNEMEEKGICSNSFTFVCILKACASIGASSKGQEIHMQVCRTGLEGELLIGSALVNWYGKCGLLAEAQDVFDKLPICDVVLWTTLIGEYVKHGYGKEALCHFDRMQSEGCPQNSVTLICGLKACGSIGVIAAGHELHIEIVRKGLERDFLIGNNLVCMYAECGALATAEEVLHNLPVQDVVACNAILEGYVEYECGLEALRCFEKLQHEHISLNAVSFVFILKACGCLGDVSTGQDVHMKIVRRGLEGELTVGSTLVSMYMKCRMFGEAQAVFDTLSSHDVISWTALITGYVDHGYGEEAIYVFKQMQHEGIALNAITCVCSLKACSCVGAIGKGREIHATIVKRGLERDPFVGNTLVYMNAKCGMLVEARDIFEKLHVRDLVSGTALLAGYVDSGCNKEALLCLEQLQHEGVSLNAAAIACSLKACGTLGALGKGQQMHNELLKKGLEGKLMAGTTLVDMYGKCASMREAQDTFDKLTVRDIVSWNALIAGYAQVVESENVIHSFKTMIQEGIRPNSATFTIVLNTCSDAGLLDMGQMLFEVLSNEYSSVITPDHYTCIVDLLGRVGFIDKAVAIIQNMAFHPCVVLWHSVLGACQGNGNVELGRLAFEHAASLDGSSIATYVFMGNIYALSTNRPTGPGKLLDYHYY